MTSSLSPLSAEELSAIAAGESDILELKESTAEKKDAVEDCCAFANHRGGTVYFGITPRKEIKGQQVSDSTLRDVGQIIRDNTDERIVPAITVWEHEGRRGVRVIVAKSPRAPHTAFGQARMRSGSETVRMPQHLYHEMLLRRDNDDWSRLPGPCGPEQLDPEAVMYMRTILGSRNPQFIQPENNEDLLKKLMLMVEGKCTNACAILLGKTEVLREHYPQAEVRYLRYEKEHPDTAVADKPFVQALVLTLRDLERTLEPSISFLPLQMGMFRAEVPLLSWDVVQEAILNACTHRDYRSNGNVYIKHYHDRLVVANPGGFLHGITPENILVSQSVSRNRLLAETFQQLRYVQRAHQGTEILFSQLLHWGKGEPEYQATESSVSLTIPTVVRDQAWIRFIVRNQERNQEQMETRHYLLLWHLRNLEIASAESLYGKTSVLYSKESLSAALHDLDQKGMLKKKGKGRGTLYMLGEAYFAEGRKRGRATRLVGLQQEELERLIVQHLKEHGPTAPGEFIGPHGLDLNRKQLTGLLTNLRKKGIVIRVGNPPRWVKYAIAPDVIDRNTKGE